MVNSNGLTVSKLSRLQRCILRKLAKEEDTLLEGLAYDVADEYKGPYARWINESPLFQGHTNAKNWPYREPGAKNFWILSNKFKASFYRSVKRLIKRGLVEKEWDWLYDEFSGRRKHFKVVKLTEEGKICLNGTVSQEEDA